MDTLHERSFAYDDEDEDENDRFGSNNANPRNNANVLKDRLNKVRSAVQKATQEAWKQANGHSPSLSSLQKENASFLLGMDLFGSEEGGTGLDTSMDGSDNVASSSSGLELAVRDKLEQVERDLARIQQEHDIMPGTHGSHSDFGEEGDGSTAEEMDVQIENYRRKVAFLKQASFARSCLEESAALSSSAGSTSAAVAASDTGEDGGVPDNLVRSAQTLLRALREVDEAEHILRDSAAEPRKEIEVAHRILSSLRHQIRRHRVELVHKAGAVLDGSVELTAATIAVKSSPQLAVAYRVLETLDDGEISNRQRGRKQKSTALQETLRGFTTRLYEEALKPILAQTLSDKESGERARRWKIDETADKRSNVIGVSTANKRGTMHLIEWNLAHSAGGDGKNDNNDNNDNSDNGIAAIPEEEAKTFSFEVVNSWNNMLDVLQRILVFVQSKVLLERQPLCSMVGKRLFGTPDAMPSLMNLSALGLESTLLGENDQGVLVEAMLDWLREQCLSKDDTKLDRVSLLRAELLESTLPFCRELEDRHLLQSEPPSRLVAFCQNFEKNFVDRRRCVRLNQAREILIKNDYHNTSVVGVEGNPAAEGSQEAALAVFRLSRCSISDTAKKLVELVRTTMDESVAVVSMPQDSPLATLRPTLYKTAREMFSLFRSIIPTNHGREVANVPRTAAVLHNDAVFLAHHCLTLGLEYKEKFPQVDDGDARGKLLKQTCIFVDMVPLFRELADTSLNDMLDLQKHQLADIVGSRITYFGQSLRSDESVHEWSEAETALAAGIYHLRHLAQAWKSILSKAVFLRSMGYLADVLLALYLTEVTSNAATISYSARQFTGGLFRKATIDIRDLLFDEGRHHQYDDPKPYSLEWGRFEAVGNFLELDQLVQVEQSLSSGVFRNVASQELARLVQATYRDSPQRKALLNCMASVV